MVDKNDVLWDPMFDGLRNEGADKATRAIACPDCGDGGHDSTPSDMYRSLSDVEIAELLNEAEQGDAYDRADVGWRLMQGVDGFTCPPSAMKPAAVDYVEQVVTAYDAFISRHATRDEVIAKIRAVYNASRLGLRYL